MADQVGWGMVVFIPRSLSSATMRAVDAHGWPAVTNGGPTHLPGAANPHGFYEHSGVQVYDTPAAVQTMVTLDLHGGGGTGGDASVVLRGSTVLAIAGGGGGGSGQNGYAGGGLSGGGAPQGF